MAQQKADAAAVTALVPFCVAKAEQSSEQATLAKVQGRGVRVHPQRYGDAGGECPETGGITPNVAAGASVGYDQLAVGGSASLAGTLAVLDDTGAYTVGGRYTILTAAGGRSGTFGTVSYDPIFANYISPVVSYDTNDVYLTLDPTASTSGPPALFNSGQEDPDMLTALARTSGGVADTVLGDVCGAEARRNVTQGQGCVVHALTAGYHSELWMRGVGGLGDLSGGGSLMPPPHCDACKDRYLNLAAGLLARPCGRILLAQRSKQNRRTQRRKQWFCRSVARCA